MPLAGIINLHKPSGMTSRAAVDQVKRLARPAKTGHAGTLDPLASGVLLVCVGSATRLTEHLQQMPKRYTGTFLLGRTSSTEDVEGEVVELANPAQPSRGELEQAAARLVGTIEQRPPQFSALKVAGRRAYDLARSGQHVELAPRQIRIDLCCVVEYEYPRLVLDIACSKGTYIRSLGRDLAESLGTGAVMSALVRTVIGPFDLASAWRPEQLTPATLAEALLPPAVAVAGLPAVVLSPAEAARIARGQAIELAASLAEAAEIAAFDRADRLVSILGPRGGGQFGALRNFPA